MYEAVLLLNKQDLGGSGTKGNTVSLSHDHTFVNLVVQKERTGGHTKY